MAACFDRKLVSCAATQSEVWIKAINKNVVLKKQFCMVSFTLII